MECLMLDIVYLVGGCLFLAVTVAYSIVCDRL
jgi:hypothetical protein